MLTREVSTMRMTGLTAQQVAERLRTEGYDELPSRGRRGVLRVALEVAHEPMFLLLIAGGVVYLVLGDISEALALLVSVFVIIGITLLLAGCGVGLCRYHRGHRGHFRAGGVTVRRDWLLLRRASST